jgi:hypothetical protein
MYAMACKVFFRMQSSRSDRWYSVVCHTALEGEKAWFCECIGFRTHRKPCRHIKGAIDALALGVRKMEVET